MVSPFDTKNKIASALDRLALRALIFSLCVGYFYWLWRSSLASLISGSALFILVLLCILLIERRTLSHRDRMLRERVGGIIALQELLLMPTDDASTRVCRLLCETFCAKAQDGCQMLYEGEHWLVRCAQCMQGTYASQSDILNAHRARAASGADQCVLASTAGFSPEAIRAAEWMDPPIRLITGRQLALLFGRRHPATDEDIAKHLSRQRKPFSWQRIRMLALSPGKLRRYLICTLLLLLLYFLNGSLTTLFSCGLSFLLALLCARENNRRYHL